MDRRAFVALLVGAATWPLAARAQLAAMPVIGFLGSSAQADWAHLVAAFHRGLNEAGFIEGQNVAIEYRWANGQYDRLPAFAAEFVRRPVAVMAAASLPAALAAKAATSQIPVVLASGGATVPDGLVKTLNRPGGKVTRVTNFFGELGAKRLELLRELVPAATMIAVLINPSNPNAPARLADVQSGARAIGQQIQLFNASNASEIDAAFAEIVRRRAGALLVGDDPVFITRHQQLVALAARHRLPTIYYIREFAVAGGLMTYGITFTDSYRRFGGYVGRILRGEKPADLPVMQPTKFELVINLKTAKALGLAVPATLLARADAVIE
ncbi:MAG: ABC transporter substrate-binding protein [Xanthobacteraceae bacterium]